MGYRLPTQHLYLHAQCLCQDWFFGFLEVLGRVVHDPGHLDPQQEKLLAGPLANAGVSVS